MIANSSHSTAKDSVDSANPLFDNLVLTYQDMAARLQIPKRTLERLVSKNQIPHRKVTPRCVRFYWPDVLEWLRNQKGAKRR